MSISFSPARGDFARSTETYARAGSKMLKEISLAATASAFWMVVARVLGSCCWGSAGLCNGDVTALKNDGRV